MNAICTPVRERLPKLGLSTLACATFVTVLTECVAAGLLPPMSHDLAIRESLTGQFTTVYALGSLLTAIPLVKLTGHMPRRPLLMASLFGLALTNSVMVWSSSYTLMLVARFFAGASAGLLWALAAGYASRMVKPTQQGQAISMVMVGIPLAMTIGIPAGTWLAQHTGWRWVFGLMSLLGVVLAALSRFALPQVAGVPPQHRGTLGSVLKRPGLIAVYAVMLFAVLAHNTLYTYIAPFAGLSGSQGSLDRLLLLFGVTSVISIAVTSVLIDRSMRALAVAGMALFLVAAAAMALWPASMAALVTAVALWGLGFGGVSAIIQTAVARRSDEQVDLGQSLVVVGWNLAIAGGGAVGGVVLKSVGAAMLPWPPVVLLVLALWVATTARKAWV